MEKVVFVSVKGDLRQEGEETFGLNINSVDYANLTDAQATGTILAGDFQFLAVGADAGGAPQVRGEEVKGTGVISIKDSRPLYFYPFISIRTATIVERFGGIRFSYFYVLLPWTECM